MDTSRMTGRSFVRNTFALGVIALGVSSTGALAAAAETTLHAFSAADGAPTAQGPALVIGSDGNYYGAVTGGTSGNGAIYRMTPAGDFAILYSFTGGTDGGQPNALVLGKDGNFYGTTSAGGAKGFGTAFRISSAGAITTLHPFHGYDGRFPNSSLIQGSDGNFYGTTLSGGIAAGCPLKQSNPADIGCGLVYRLTPKGAVKVLHKFDFRSGDGWVPTGVMQASNGALYGTTEQRTIDSGGVAYKLSIDGSSYQILTSFGGSNGYAPTAPPTEGIDGNFYGTTELGGYGAGNVYSFTPAGSFSTLFSFQTDIAPSGGLVQNPTTGTFYGLTGAGLYNGVMFSITPSGSYTTEYSFTGGSDGGQPSATLVPASAGYSNLIGTTITGGSFGKGAIYSLQVQ